MIPWLRHDAGFVLAPWRHGWTTGEGPDCGGDPAGPAMAEAAGRVARAVGLETVAWANQVHGGAVLEVRQPGCAGDADALWTDRPGLALVGRSADCPLVLVAADAPRPLWGFAHASWRSTVRRITAGLVDALCAAGARPERMRALVAPSAGPCCYEVGDEVRQEALARLGPAAAEFFRPAADRWILDLWAANLRQLADAGVPAGAVTVVGACTICTREYPSYRREGAAAGRFAAVIGRP